MKMCRKGLHDVDLPGAKYSGKTCRQCALASSRAKTQPRKCQGCDNPINNHQAWCATCLLVRYPVGSHQELCMECGKPVFSRRSKRLRCPACIPIQARRRWAERNPFPGRGTVFQCEHCAKDVVRTSSRQKYCSRACKNSSKAKRLAFMASAAHQAMLERHKTPKWKAEHWKQKWTWQVFNRIQKRLPVKIQQLAALQAEKQRLERIIANGS